MKTTQTGQAGTSRRQFMRGALAAGAAGWTFARMDAASAARVIGANDRVSLGLIGCGGRGRWVMQNMVQPANANTALVAVCDIWKKRRDTYPAEAEKLHGLKPEVSAAVRRRVRLGARGRGKGEKEQHHRQQRPGGAEKGTVHQAVSMNCRRKRRVRSSLGLMKISSSSEISTISPCSM